jgi:hypothetical protein
LSVHTSYDNRVDLSLRMQGASLVFVLSEREASPEDVAHTLATDLAEKVAGWAEGEATGQ